MALVSWSPFREMDDLFNQYGRLLSRASSERAESQAAVDWRPAANIAETEQEYVIRAELPEVDRKDIEVSVHDGVLTLRGERRLEKTGEGEKHLRLESYYGNFARSFTLPADVDQGKISADTKDGVLTVHLPKTEVAKPRAIDIQVR